VRLYYFLLQELTMSIHSRPSLLLAALAVGLMAGCAGAPKKVDLPPEQAVAALAAERWELLRAGKWEEAYAMLTPGYREAITFDGFRATYIGSPVVWTSSEVSGVTCSTAESCTARVKVGFKIQASMAGLPGMESADLVEESWLNIDGTWMHLPRR